MNSFQQTIVSPASVLSLSALSGVDVVPVRERVETIDVIRGIALFGVLMVNLTTEFRVSIFQQFLGITEAGSGTDRLLANVISAGLESKAFALFSILFGVGLAIQFDRLMLRGSPFYWLVRRLLVLMAFGLVHLLFIWNGDILTEYALVGLLVLPLLRARTHYIAAAAIICLIIFAAQASMPWTIQWPSATSVKQHVELANTTYSTASYIDFIHFSHKELPLLLPLHLFVLARTIGLFLLGMFLWRVGVFTHSAKFKWPIRIAAVLGVTASCAVIAIDRGVLPVPWPLMQELLSNTEPIMLAVGYGATIMLLMEVSPIARVLGMFAPLGRMAFTNYLMQSVVCGFIFFGYGLGLFGHMAMTPAFALGVVIYLLQIIISNYWLRQNMFGPLEWLWRTLMYGKIQPMRKRSL